MIDRARARTDVLMGLWYSDERDRIYHFSKPFLANRIVFVKAASDDYEFTDLDSLRGKQVGTIRKYVYQQEFVDHPEIKKVVPNPLLRRVGKKW